MKIGYARVLTEDQCLDLQVDHLRKEGCAKIFAEKITGGRHCRPALKRALSTLRDGDVLVVWKLDRLGRSLQHLIEIVQTLDDRNIGFQSLSDNIDTTSAGGRLMFHVIGAMAEFERALISERTKAGMKAAQRKGVRLGRPRCFNGQQIARARFLLEQEEFSLTDIALELNVARTTLWRALSTNNVR